MTDDYQIDINHVETLFSEQLQGIELHVTERNIGNGPQFAIEVYNKPTGDLINTSYWYTKSEFKALCEGMKFLSRVIREAEKIGNE